MMSIKYDQQVCRVELLKSAFRKHTVLESHSVRKRKKRPQNNKL